MTGPLRPCTDCGQCVRRRGAAGLCAPCVRRLAARTPEPGPPSLADDMARARDRALARQAAWLAGLRERMALLRERYGEDAGETGPKKRRHGPIGLAANVRRADDR